MCVGTCLTGAKPPPAIIRVSNIHFITIMYWVILKQYQWIFQHTRHSSFVKMNQSQGTNIYFARNNTAVRKKVFHMAPHDIGWETCNLCNGSFLWKSYSKHDSFHKMWKIVILFAILVTDTKSKYAFFKYVCTQIWHLKRTICFSRFGYFPLTSQQFTCRMYCKSKNRHCFLPMMLSCFIKCFR